MLFSWDFVNSQVDGYGNDPAVSCPSTSPYVATFPILYIPYFAVQNFYKIEYAANI